MAGLEAGILEDIRLSRLRYRQRNEPVLEPQSPPRYNDFPGKPAQGDPNGVKKKVEYSAVNGPRWSNEQYHRFLHTAMEPRFPPVLKGIVETRLKSDQVVFERLEGFDDELDYITRSKRENTGKFEAWHKERSELEVALLHMAQELRKDHADQVESVYQAHHAHRHRRIPNSQYSSVKQHHVDEMEKLLSIIHKVAETIGILYAERGAVAQGVVPRHGDMYGKLDLVRIAGRSNVDATLFPPNVSLLQLRPSQASPLPSLGCHLFSTVARSSHAVRVCPTYALLFPFQVPPVSSLQQDHQDYHGDHVDHPAVAFSPPTTPLCGPPPFLCSHLSAIDILICDLLLTMLADTGGLQAHELRQGDIPRVR